MSASNALENGVLELILNNQALANIGDVGGLQPSAANGDLYISLHTGDPGEAGSQTTNECAYTSYARVAIDRDGAAWTVTNNSGVNAAAVTFPKATGGSETATHFAVGTATSGVGVLLLSNALDSNLAISTNIQPNFAAGQLAVTAE